MNRLARYTIKIKRKFIPEKKLITNGSKHKIAQLIRTFFLNRKLRGET